MTTKVLNLYAGIGGNRKRWEDVDVTAVEINESVADCYRDHFPEDEVIVGDAHEYLREHYDEYDFIWSSPPCPTHSKLARIHANNDTKFADTEVHYPDMRLYQEILLLQHFYDGDYVVENVESYYDPLIEPQRVHRHYFWSNVYISDINLPPVGKMDTQERVRLEEEYGYDLSEYDFTVPKVKVISNCVHPKLGEHVFDAATGERQTTASDWVES